MVKRTLGPAHYHYAVHLALWWNSSRNFPSREHRPLLVVLLRRNWFINAFERTWMLLVGPLGIILCLSLSYVDIIVSLLAPWISSVEIWMIYGMPLISNAQNLLHMVQPPLTSPPSNNFVNAWLFTYYLFIALFYIFSSFVALVLKG